ncbi:hypothetical protein OEZ86_009825 [Tetradesmus obliquus]|uniref:Protein kinase domain-containing protein n=1 Tax=Tetradesmus obliquus TaxID=3088 RepID=A0ABY8UNH5_TETOB|nr:hypothetical protein OEZ85_001265 [Tetradesmus obliquus]WIA43330.1 hypothetical protein OEZ86_009825 [Tetradesmus obliquus]
MFAKLSALVGGGPALNFNVDPHQYDTAWGCWTHHSGTSKEDGSAVSVFKIAAADPNDVKLVAARNGVKRLKMLRHPNVLAFKDSLEVQEKGMTVLYLVTEAVRPLAMVMQELDLSGHHRDEYLATGMLHMTNAVSFINNSCNMIHGYLCMAAVVVTDSLDWKLHGFDLLSEHALTGDFALKHASWMVASQYKPAELAKCEWQAVQQGPPWAVDSWGLGCMMQEVFSGQPLTAVEQLRRTDVIPPALLADYQKLLSSQTGRRLNPAKVAESRFLNNKLVEVVGFMENISLKDSAEKDSFFKKLPAMIPAIPEPVAVRKLLPLLSSSLEFGGAPASAVSSLMLIGRMLSGDEFIRRVVPSLSRLFASSDRNLRRNLLESIDTYGQHLTTDVIEGQIYPPLSAGFTDENAYIRELTLKSLLVLAPKMRQATLTQNLLKHLSRLQVDNEPSIRANTTVLLGNIAQYLGDTYCKKVLLNAFGRALKDSFPPARVAALRALIATVKHYDANELALRALPAVSPLCIDPLTDVRASALCCMDAFTAKLREHDAKLQEAAAAAAAAAGGSAAATAAGSGGAAAAGGSSGMLGWAMSSLAASSAALGGWDEDFDDELEDMDKAEQEARNRLASLSTSRNAASSSSSRPAAPAAAAKLGGSSSSTPSSRPAAAAAAAAAGGWNNIDDGDGWDSLDTGSLGGGSSSTAVKPAAAAGGSHSTGSSTVSSPTAAAVRSRPVRPAGGAAAAAGGSGGLGAKPVHKGAMKLGASKLGAQKIQFD